MNPTHPVNPQDVVALAFEWRDPIGRLAQRLVQTESPAGGEGALAGVLAGALGELGYGEVFVDGFGNVVGRIGGKRTAPSVLFVAPLDHAAAEADASWPHPPHAGVIEGGWLHGRGASDHKAAIAAMAFGGAILQKLGVAPGGDYLFAGVCHSTTGAGAGMRHLIDKTLPERGWHADLVVVGGPTGLDVVLGNRGRVEVAVETIGRTCHAGVPWLGINAVYKMQPIVLALQELAMRLPSHPFLDKASLALTGVTTSPSSGQAVPDRCVVSVDRRFLPSESPDEVVWQLQSILNRLADEDHELKAELRVRQVTLKAHTGESQTAACLVHPFITEARHALVQSASAALSAVGQTPRYSKWTYVSDAGYPSTLKKLATIGYGPGHEKFSQTPFDRVALDEIVQATAGYAAIALAVSA